MEPDATTAGPGAATAGPHAATTGPAAAVTAGPDDAAARGLKGNARRDAATGALYAKRYKTNK